MGTSPTNMIKSVLIGLGLLVVVAAIPVTNRDEQEDGMIAHLALGHQPQNPNDLSAETGETSRLSLLFEVQKKKVENKGAKSPKKVVRSPNPASPEASGPRLSGAHEQQMEEEAVLGT